MVGRIKSAALINDCLGYALNYLVCLLRLNSLFDSLKVLYLFIEISYIYLYIYIEYNTNSGYKWTPQEVIDVYML